AYVSPTAPEAQYLWRWIGMHAPDHVFELVEGVANHVVPAAARPSDTLAAQLEKVPACQVGLIPATSWSVPPGNTTPFAEVAQLLLQEIARGNASLDQVHKSAARRELEGRDSRTALEVAQQLSRVYGHDLPSVAYIPAVACIGRLRLAKLTGDRAMVDDVQRIASESARGTKPTLTDKSSGSELAGHILFGELFDATGDKAWNPLVQRAADWAFTAEGQPREAMPTHNEMSDAVFMGCPILAQAGRLTGERKYWDMCVQHLRFMRKLDLRPDGLYRHSPLDETAWGRGNGFPALGLALALADVPADYSGRQEMLAAFQAHLSALLEHQDPTGAWHQVVDHPESYRELTSTCMITYAMTRGVRAGWLEKATFEQPIARGWKAIKSRVAADGTLVDVCTGTGKMKSLREYLDRPAILGRDGRGGAMALLVATEIAAWEAE
ncbi:MAG: glycoside hydrolase family 88 protein, partial [Aureliella sp.]